MDKSLRVCIGGAGNASHALAALLPSKGIETTWLASFENAAEQINATLGPDGKIEALFADHNNPSGLVTGRPTVISADPAEVVPQSDVILLPLPSFAYPSELEQLKPHLRPGMAIGVTPGQGGFDWIARNSLGDLVDDLIIFAIMPMPFNCRIQEFGKRVEVQEFKSNYHVATLPPTKSSYAVQINEQLFGKSQAVGHFLNATLYPINAIIHPARLYTLCKDWQPGQILAENPLFYEDMGEADVALMDAVNQELLQIASALTDQGMEAINVPHIHQFLTKFVYEDPNDLLTFFKTNPAYIGFRCPFKPVLDGWIPDFSNRYFSEDIPLGLCIYKGVADIVGVKTPQIDQIIVWAQGHMQKEYIVNGRLIGRHVVETNAPQRFGITAVNQL